MAETQITVEDIRAAARRALSGGDTAAAQRLIAAGRALEAQGVQNGIVQPDGQIIAREPLIPTVEGSVPVDTTDPDAGLMQSIMSDYVNPALEGAGYLGQEMARGVTQLAGAPVDIVNMLPMVGNILPGEQGIGPISDNPTLGSEDLWKTLSLPRDAAQGLFGMPQGDADPQNGLMRLLGRVANEVGSVALPVGAGLSVGRTLGREATQLMSRAEDPLRRTIGNYLERFAVAPAGTVRNELGMATAAGTGAGVAQMLADDGDPNAQSGWEIGAELLGAGLGAAAYAPTANALTGARNIAGYALGQGSFADDVVNDAVAARILQDANPDWSPEMGAMDSDPLAASIRAGGTNVDGWSDTLADRTRIPGITALEYSRSTGPNSGNFFLRRQQNAEMANMAIEDFVPQSTPAPFRTALDDAADRMLEDSQVRLATAQADFDTAIADLQVAYTSEGRGETIRSALDAALRSAREVEEQAWRSVTGEVDPVPLSEAFETITNGLPLADRDLVSSMGSLLSIPSDLAKTPGLANLDEVTALRSRLTTMQRQARADGDTNTARVVGMYVDALDNSLAQNPSIADALADARAVSYDLNERFTRTGTAVADTLASRPSGGPRLPPDAVPRRFLAPDTGAARETETLLRETTLDPSVTSALRDQIIADVRSQGLLDKPDQLNRYLAQYSRAFQSFPELRDQLGTAASLRRTIGEAESGLQDVQRTVQPGSRSAIGQYRRFGPENATASMETVMAADQPDIAVRELLQTAGQTPGTTESLRSAFWEYLRTKAQPITASNRTIGNGTQKTDPWNFTRLFSTLEDPKVSAAARELYADNPEHLANLEELAATLRDTDVASLARRPGSSGTPQALAGNRIMPSSETLGAYSFAYQRGQIGLPYIGVRLASTMARNAVLKGRTDMYGQVLDRALLDPEFAAQLLEDYNPAVAEVLSRSAVGWFGAQADEFVDLLTPPEEEEQGEDQELMDAIMVPSEPLRMTIDGSP
jgi:hypothetical protein